MSLAASRPAVVGRDGEPWRLSKRLGYGVVHGLVRAFIGLVLALPTSTQRSFSAVLGTFVWLVWSDGRRRVAGNWQAAMGQPPRSSDVRRCFRRTASLLFDTVRLLDADEPAERTLGLDDRSESVFREALEAGRGVVFISAHLGPFERLAAVIASRGLPAVVVARESYDSRITSLYERMRRPRGVHAIYRAGRRAGVRVAKVLARGGAVGFLIDLPARVPCLALRMLGRDCRIPVGPGRLALAKKCEVVVGTPIAPTGDARPLGVGSICIERVETGDLQPGEAGERELTQRVVAVLERRIRREPEAWLGMFRSLETS